MGSVIYFIDQAERQAVPDFIDNSVSYLGNKSEDRASAGVYRRDIYSRTYESGLKTEFCLKPRATMNISGTCVVLP
jgi:hypothetical protein